MTTLRNGQRRGRGDGSSLIGNPKAQPPGICRGDRVVTLRPHRDRAFPAGTHLAKAPALIRNASSAVTRTGAPASRPRYDAETTACPADRPFTTPSASTVTTSGRVEDHVASRDTTGVWPERRRATAMQGPFSPISIEAGQDTSSASMSASPPGAPPLGDVGTTLAPPHAVTPSVATTAIECNALRHWSRVKVCECLIHRSSSFFSGISVA